MIRIKKQTIGNYTVTDTFTDDDGNALTPSGSVTAQLFNGAGTLVASPSATNTGAVLSCSITNASLSYLDTYTITWSFTTGGQSVQRSTIVELVGGYLFEIADMRAQDRTFKDLTKYPTPMLRAIRTAVEQVIEGPLAARVAFVPRGARVTVDGSSPDLTRAYNPLIYGSDYRGLQVPDFQVRELYSVKINDVALDSEDVDAIAIDDNMLWKSAGVQYPAWPHGHRNIEIHYEHGYDYPPHRISEVALLLATEYLIKSDLPKRATATSIGDQMFRLTIAGRDGVTGIPEVDAAIDQFGRAGFGIG